MLDRDNVLDEENAAMIQEMGINTIFLQKEEVSGDFSIIYNTLNKDTSNSELEAVQHIYRQLRGSDAPDDETARGIIEKLFFSDKRYDLGEVGRSRLDLEAENVGEEAGRRDLVAGRHDRVIQPDRHGTSMVAAPPDCERNLRPRRPAMQRSR